MSGKLLSCALLFWRPVPLGWASFQRRSPAAGVRCCVQEVLRSIFDRDPDQAEFLQVPALPALLAAAQRHGERREMRCRPLIQSTSRHHCWHPIAVQSVSRPSWRRSYPIPLFQFPARSPGCARGGSLPAARVRPPPRAAAHLQAGGLGGVGPGRRQLPTGCMSAAAALNRAAFGECALQAAAAGRMPMKPKSAAITVDPGQQQAWQGLAQPRVLPLKLGSSASREITARDNR